MQATYDELLAENLHLIQIHDDMAHEINMLREEVNALHETIGRLSEQNVKLFNRYSEVSSKLNEYQKNGRFYDRVRTV